MKSASILVLLFAFIIGLPANPQTYYRLKYKSPVKADTTAYDAFFVLYDNGSGFVRVNSTSTVPGNNALAEMEIQEQYATNKDGTIDTSRLVYEAKNPRFINPDTKMNLPPVTYWFNINPLNTTSDPWGVSVGVNNVPDTNNFFTSELITSQALTDTALVLNFFTTKDAFYKNRFGPKTKGINQLRDDEKDTRLLLLVVASTYDASIGPATLLDGRKAIETFGNVAAFLHIKPVFDSVYGSNNYGRASVEKALSKLNPKPNDIVVFFYSGHGFSDAKSSDPKRRSKIYPYLDLLDPRQKPRPNPRDSAMNIEDIYTLIKSRGGRFNLVISDCCNDSILPKKETVMPPSPTKKGVPGKWNWPNVYALFMKERLSLLLTSASRGEGALGENNKGGVYTNALLETLKTNLLPDKSNPVWPQILTTAQQQTIIRITNAKLPCSSPSQPNGICHQTPPFPKIN